MVISEISIKRPVFATVMSLLIVVVGIMFYSRLEIRGIPNIDPPVITVTSDFEGADAAFIEQNITSPIEKILRTVRYIDYIQSTSQSGKSEIFIIFKLSADLDEAMNDVRSKISEVSNGFPESMKPPKVQKMDSNAWPSFWISATSDRYDDMELTAILYDKTIRALEKIPSVGFVMLSGASYYNMQITPDPGAMYALKVTPLEIERAIRAQNKDYPAGAISTTARQFIIKLGGALKEVDEFKNIIIRSEKDGLVKLEQVAKVEIAPTETEERTRYNGKKCVAMGAIKQSSSNVLAMSEDILKTLPKMRSALPAGIDLHIAHDQAVPIGASINSVYMTIFEALALVTGVVFLFLQSARLTLIPFVTIPVSLIGTFAFMYALGFSINTFTLLAMILAIGLVVDDAIVMLENIFRHYSTGAYGADGIAAAHAGSKEIGFAILAMTITLAAVFMPVGFDQGFLGKMFIEFAWTLAFCVIVSGFVALTLTPMMTARMVNSHTTPESNSIFTSFQTSIEKVTNLYLHYLGLAMSHGKKFWLICLGSIFVLILSFVLANKGFAPMEDEGYLFIFAQGPEGSSTDHTDEAMKKVEEVLGQHKDVEGYFTWMQGGESAFVFVPLKLWDQRSKSSAEIQGELNRRFREIPEMSVFATLPQPLGGGMQEKDVEFVLYTNEEWDLLQNLTVRGQKDMRAAGIFNEIESDLKVLTPTLDVIVDRDKAYLYGVPMENIGTTLQYLIAGRNVGNFRMNNETYDVTMRYAKEDRSNISDLSKIYLKNDKGALLYLDTVADIEEKISIKSYNHYNSSKSLKLSASLAEGKVITEAIDFVKNWVASNKPDKVDFKFIGQVERMEQTESNILTLFGLALVFIYLVLAAQFESWKDPLIILLSVPFSITGGVVAIVITGSSLNLFSDIGLVTLIGLVTKNAIMIVEFANHLRESGLDKVAAIVEAAKMRLRPILMTTIATIAGAVPLAFASGAGAGARHSVGIVIVGGMLVGTLFTLFVIPMLYKKFK